ncbi:MAG: glycosyltransferase family 2 protein [bacterium]
MISVIIPVYKKTEEFIKNIKSNLPFLRETEIIVINDDPKLSIKKYLKDLPIKLYENKKNLGFGGSVNKGVGLSKNKYVFLLNSDVLLNNNSYKNVLKLFRSDKDLFAVSFAQTEKNNEIVGKNNVFWKSGFFRHKKATNSFSGYTAWAEGGTSIFSKSKFLELGGFDLLYTPFYWEDIDLSYRAWKKGYKILYNSKVLVKHHHESTISTYFSKNTVKKISYRNQFIFIWKNITDLNLLFSHFILLFPNLLFFIIKREVEILYGFINALFKIIQILKKRNWQKKFYTLTDKEIMTKINEK